MHIGKTGEFPALSQLRGLELKGEVGALAGASDVEAVSDSRNGRGFRFVGPVDELTISPAARRLAQQSEENPFHALVERESHKQMLFKASRDDRREMRVKESLDASRAKILGPAIDSKTETKERDNATIAGFSKKSERVSTPLLEKRARLRAQAKESKAKAQAAERKKDKPLFEARGPLAEKQAAKYNKLGEDFEPGPFIELEGDTAADEEFELPFENTTNNEER